MSQSPAEWRTGRFGVWLALFAGLICCTVPLRGQNTQPAVSPASGKQTNKKSGGTAAASAADYSNEPVVFQSVVSKLTFQKDGTADGDSQVTEKIQTQAGVQDASILSMPYASANATLTVVYVRVRKADGTVVETPTGSVEDMPAAITRQAPYYSDIREKQVAVKGLEAGSTLEYEYRFQEKPLTPGEFWYDYNFVQNAISLSEELQVSVPKSRNVIVSSGSLKPSIDVNGGERIYMWKTSHLRQEEADATERARESLEEPPADVQVTTFRSWAELGKWYGGLAAPHAAPTPAIRAEEEKLTKGMTSEAEKLRAIYDYVSLKFRYVGVAFGIGRYQPHTADEVLSNDYGDCKDKETLLAALLAAAGVKAYPALISSSHKIDPNLPSPGDFDHLIAAVPQGKGYLWLDTTPGVTPAGYLLPNLRDKEALVIPDDGPAELVKTPANPPFPMSESFTVDGKLDTAGTLDADMKTSVHDDSEILLRLAFRATPEARWENLVQALSYRMGYGGTVSNVALGPLDTTDPSLDISYHYTRKDYPSWSDGKITLPLPQFYFPDAGDKTKKAKKPLYLGAPDQYDYTAHVTLPAGYTPVLPAPKNLVEDFAEYHTRYAFANGTLEGERRLIVKVSKAPVAELAAYKKFIEAVKDDEASMVSLEAKSAASSASAATQQAQTFYEQGRKAMQQRDLADAAEDFRKAIAADAKFGLAWSGMGAVHLEQGDRDEAIADMKKAIAVDPKQELSYKMLARTQILMRQPEAALATWQSLEKVDPNDGDAPANIGFILVFLKRYADAVPVLEKAAKLDPTNAQVLLNLGQAELHTSEAENAFAVLQQGLKLDPTAEHMNDVAYELADANQHLDTALAYAEKAVQREEEKTENLSLDSLSFTDLKNMQYLSYFWDTLGWAYFRLGQDAEAEKYLRAAWNLSHLPDLADHVGQLYQKEGKVQEATRYYALALAAPHAPAFSPLGGPGGGGTSSPELSVDAMPKTRARLKALLKSDSRVFEAVERAREELSKLRTVTLPALTKKPAMAQFYVLFAAGPEPKVAGVKFISGSESLRLAAKDLAAARFNVRFPDSGQEKIVRQGVLDCEPEVPHCQFVLVTPDSVQFLP